jgi:transposase-like protein
MEVSQSERRKFTREIKVAAVRMLESGHSAASVARAHEADPGLLHRWRQECRKNPVGAFPGMGRAVPIPAGILIAPTKEHDFQLERPSHLTV